MTVRYSLITAIVTVACMLPAVAVCAPLLLNEYNAVRADRYLNGGDELADADGGKAADPYFGRIVGNGGNWFELVVVAEPLDLRGWRVVVDDAAGGAVATITFSQAGLWSNLRAGTIVTVAEDLGDDPSYDPQGGDWWIHVQAGSQATGVYVDAVGFEVSHQNTLFRIYDDGGRLVFGPVGEGAASPSGVNSREVAKLEADPTAAVKADSPDFNDGTSSTFGLPNVFKGGAQTQDFGPLRAGAAPPGDGDFDGIADCGDNCPEAANSGQTDGDGDGYGDACDPDQGGVAGPGLPQGGCGEVDLFDPDTLLEVEVFISGQDWDSLRYQSRPLLESLGQICPLGPPPEVFDFFPADVSVNGELVSNVGVRKKGFLGSLSRNRPSLKLKFSEYDGRQRLFGLERMTLNNARQDPSKIKQCLAFKLFADAGLVASRCNFAHVRVTTELATHDLGIYLNVETIKAAFLVQSFGSAAGNLYEAMLSDFRPGWVSTYQRKTNEGSNHGADVVALTRMLETVSDSDLLGQLASYLDVDEFITFWAMEAMVGHWDGYTGDRNNYYVYKNPSDGLFHFMTWGNDDTFGQGNPLMGEGGLASLLWARGILARRLYLMPGGAESYRQRLQQLFDTVWDETAIFAEIDRMEILLGPVTGDLSAFIDPVRNFVIGRRQRFAEDFASGPPLWDEALDERPCLQDVGFFEADFRTTWGSTIPSAPGDDDSLLLSGTVYGQEFRGVGRYNYMLAGGSDLPAFSDRATFRLIFTVPSSGIFVVQAMVDPEELVPGAVISIESHLVNAFLHLEGLTPVFIGALADASLVLDAVEVSTEPGGVIGGSLSGKLTQFAPCPSCPLSTLSRQSQKCQDAVARAGRVFALKRMKALQRCRNRLNRGVILWEKGQALAVSDPISCEREAAAARAIRKTGRNARRVVSRRCQDGLLSELTACGVSVDDLTSAEGTSGCLIESHSSLVDGMLADEYGLGLGVDQGEERRCQEAVAKAGRVYLGARLKAEGECRQSFHRGFELFLDEARTQSLKSPLDCGEEVKTARAIARAGAKARRLVANPASPACEDSLLAAMTTCATTVDGLVGPAGDGGCLIDGHAKKATELALQQYCHGMRCPY